MLCLLRRQGRSQGVAVPEASVKRTSEPSSERLTRLHRAGLWSRIEASLLDIRSACVMRRARGEVCDMHASFMVQPDVTQATPGRPVSKICSKAQNRRLTSARRRLIPNVPAYRQSLRLLHGGVDEMGSYRSMDDGLSGHCHKHLEPWVGDAGQTSRVAAAVSWQPPPALAVPKSNFLSLKVHLFPSVRYQQ